MPPMAPPPFGPTGPYVISGIVRDESDNIMENTIVKLVNVTKNLYGTPSNGGVVITASDGSFSVDLDTLGNWDNTDKITIVFTSPGKFGLHTQAVSGSYLDIGVINIIRRSILCNM